MSAVAAPLFISGRLMAALRIDGVGTLHLSAGSRDHDGRLVYSYVIEDNGGADLETGCDLRSGCGDAIDYTATMSTLLSFLTACAEGGECADLFSPAVAEWATTYSDELGMAQWDLSGDES